MCIVASVIYCFFFQAEDGIRDAQESRGLGDVYKRQTRHAASGWKSAGLLLPSRRDAGAAAARRDRVLDLSLIHI